ncbi:MAG TPA: phosphoribosyltransferase family protein [Candidatus Omnitrophota bacterium]|nr:phosphoribosyltransferase family protein [Candidatus Omnitrophota bacterium]
MIRESGKTQKVKALVQNPEKAPYLKQLGKLYMISRSEEPFRDRQEAGRLLAQTLLRYHGEKTVVLGIPRGGVVVANEIANVLSAPLDVVFAHKLGAPENPELAMGAVTENGALYLNERITSRLIILPEYIAAEKERQLNHIKQKSALFRRLRPKIPLKGKTVIITDDGVATGATLQAALWSARMEKPKKLIAAVPVGPEETLRQLSVDADEMVCLRVPAFLTAIGQFYIHFGQVEDSEVLEMLKRSVKRRRNHEHRNA